MAELHEELNPYAQRVEPRTGKPGPKKKPNDSVPTPDWFLSLFSGWHDPYPLGCENITEPPIEPTRIFCNPGYSRKEEAAERCIRWHQLGHFVALLVPIESSTQFAKTLFQYGCERMYFDRRIFPNCRGVELLVLTGGPDEQTR